MSTPDQASGSPPIMTYREAIGLAQMDAFEGDERVVLLGEDVGSDGGVFKTNIGLRDRFGAERVIDTPICENGFTGAALGMAVTGLRPVVEIMFSDFLPTAADAIVNEIPKFRFMSGGQCSVPLTIRSIGGATGRFGTQHSATGESWYMSFPGLRVVTAGTVQSAYSLLRASIEDDNPVLFYEHRALYSKKGPLAVDDAPAKIGKAEVLREGSDVTLIATLFMVDRALAAAGQLADEGISAEVIDLRWLRPLDVELLHQSAAKTGHVVVVEEQVHAAGWGSTVLSEIGRHGDRNIGLAAVSLPDDLLIPYTPSLEDLIVPSAEQIAVTVRRLLGQTA